MQLHEQYRPRTWDGVVGQEKAVAAIRRVLARGWGGRAWWITGASGTGKTTVARLIALEGAEEFYVEELDAGTLTPARLRDVEDEMRFKALGAKQGRAYVVNEAHGLRKDTIRLLLVLLERLPEHVCFVFTTTKTGQEALFEHDVTGDASPLLSRCVEVVLANDESAQLAMAARAKQIAMAEGIDGLPEMVYRRAVSAARGNMRAMLQRIESGAFKDDAREAMERELAMLTSTKGESAAARRAQLAASLATLAR